MTKERQATRSSQRPNTWDHEDFPELTPRHGRGDGLRLKVGWLKKAATLLLTSLLATAISASSGSAESAAGGHDGHTANAVQTERPSVAWLPTLGDHALWVPDRLLGHSLLFDADSGDVLGMIDSPLLLTPQTPIVARDRQEIYSVDVAYERGLRGKRTDFLTIYDLKTLAVKDDIVFPSHAATGNTAIAYSSRIGSRFFGIFNQFPVTSISILDLERRVFVEEIGVSGCSGIYAIDKLRFATLCGDGTTTVIELTNEGRKAKLIHSAKFFDTLADPVFTAAGQIDKRWIFVSFGGMIHDVDFSATKPVAAPAWSLYGEGKSAESSPWRPGGLQLVAVHAASQYFFVVMHEVEKGESGTHKDAGPEIWKIDLVKKKVMDRFQPPSLAGAFLGENLGIDPDSFAATLLNWVLPPDTVHSIAVSQDQTPLLFMRNAELGAIGVVDSQSGETLRILGEAGLFGPTLRVP